MNGVLMDVKRMAVHDGPGLRTTLFLKGCPLRCLWCHNPEGQGMRPQIAWYMKKCVGCDACVRACPQGCARDLSDREKCTACSRCVSVCPTGARKLYGRVITIEEALALALEDRPFYGEKGGVTLSGGEPLAQAEFALALLKALRDAGVNTALDTCGYAPWPIYERSLPLCGVYLFDIKHMDSEEHRRLTGQGNELILDNLRRLLRAGARVQIRMPLIPGLNDAPENIDRMAGFLQDTPPECVKLLPYHQMARLKYAALGMPDRMPEGADDMLSRLERVAARLRAAGLKTYYDW